MKGSTHLERLYDVALDDDLREKVRSRRAAPDGRQLETSAAIQGGRRVTVYPWAAMRLGDFFFVPLLDRKPGHLGVRLRQAAARRDWELTITPWDLPNGEKGIRVALTLTGVNAVKKRAITDYGVKGLSFCDGRWSETRKRRYHAAKGRTRPVRSPDRRMLVDEDRPLAVDAAIRQSQQVDATAQPGYDRAAILRERLSQLGAD